MQSLFSGGKKHSLSTKGNEMIVYPYAKMWMSSITHTIYKNYLYIDTRSNILEEHIR